MKMFTAPYFDRYLLYFYTVLFFLLISINNVFPQCNMGNLTSTGGQANLSSGSDCIFRMTNTGTFGRRTTVKFNNGTTSGGGAEADDYVSFSGGFDETFNVFLGCNDAGGDGLAFVLTDAAYWQWDAEGASGGGLGFHQDAGLNMVALEFDTYQNTNADLFPIDPGDTNWDNELAADHITLNCNGQVDNLCPGATVQAMPNMEDGLIHSVRIAYDAATNTLRVYWDGSLVYSVVIDLETRFSSGAQWGWTAGTGSQTNESYVAWNDTSSPPCYNTTCNPSSGTTGACAPLPVEFLELSAQKSEGSVIVEWSTAKESSNLKFVIERSPEPLTGWHSIGEVPGAVNSLEVSKYSFTDLHPIPGTSYYRIRQVDLDGKSSVSKVVSVTKDEFVFAVYPNPFEYKLEIHTTREILRAELFNMQGDFIKEINMPVKSGGYYDTDLSYLKSGNYVLKIIEKDYSFSFTRIVKK